MNDTETPRKRYIGQVYTALHTYETFMRTHPIVVGDFNWNVMWDESPASSLCGDFTETIEILNDYGLTSGYHHSNDVEFGNEPDPTFFMHKKEDRPYHIDYAFVPEVEYSIRDYSVGTYDGWIDASDHMPITIELAERV